MKIKKIILTLLSASLLLFTLFAMSSCKSGSGIEYKLNTNKGSYTLIKAELTSTQSEFDIPETYEGLPVTGIAEHAFLNQKNLKKLFIPSTVKDIEIRAFENCENLNTILIDPLNSKYEADGNCIIEKETKTVIAGCKASVIPTDGSVEKIGKYAFYNCKALTVLDMPESVNQIGEYAFCGCSGLRSLFIREDVNVGYYAFDLTDLTVYYQGEDYPQNISNWWFLPDSGYKDRINLKIKDIHRSADGVEYAIDNSLTAKAISCLSHVEGTITVQDSVKGYAVSGIGNYAFSGCTELNNIILPSSVRTIGSGAFKGCTSLETVEIPEGVKSIEYEAFYKCENMSSVILPTTISSIEHFAFAKCASLVSITIPDNVLEIKSNTFTDCTSLKNVRLSAYLKKISSGAFQGCKSLEEITLPGTLSEIENYAFMECKTLSKIVIPAATSKIEDFAFDECPRLKIYARAKQKPSNWSNNWNASDYPVVWGYEGD